MRRGLVIILAIALLMTVSYALGDTDLESVLTSEKWKSSDTQELIIKKDHTAEMISNGYTVACTWTFDDPVLTLTYEMYGTRTFILNLEKTDSGWQLGKEEVTYYPQSDYAAIMESAADGINAYPIRLGETIRLPFANITFNRVAVVQRVGLRENGVFVTATSGNRFFELNGTIENLYPGSLSTNKVTGQMIVNDLYIYSLDTHLNKEYTSGSTLELSNVAPRTSCSYSLFASIPESMIEEARTISVLFAINSNFSSVPKQLSEGEFVFRIDLDEVAVEAAKDPSFEREIFEECPILPKPTSYMEIRQTGKSTSSSGGKLTKATYRYKSVVETRGIAGDLLAKYFGKLKEEGFTVQENTIISGNIKLAEVKLESDTIVVEIAPGNETLTGVPGATFAEPPVEKVFKLKEKIASNTAEITLKKVSVEKKIVSNMTGKGRYEYYYSFSGTPFYTVSGTFKNTGTVPVDIKHIYAAVIINGNDQYRAEVIGVAKGATDFIHYISPKQETDCIVYAEIPKNVVNGAKTIEIKLGFTDDFSIMFVSEGGLPLFEHCDETFIVKTK